MKYTLIFALLLAGGCATGPGIFPAAMDQPAAAGHSKAKGGKSGVYPLTSYDRDLLRIGKRIFDTMLGVSGRDRGLNYTGRIRVYRWGNQYEAPIEDYAWDPDRGQRWHVVRECESGVPGLTTSTGMNPVKGYHAAEHLSLAVVSPPKRDAAPAIPEVPREPEAEAEPEPGPAPVVLPALTWN